MSFRRYCLAPLAILLAAGMASAQNSAPDLKIDRVSQDDGLPTLPVNLAFEDEQGFVWLSSWSGLYRHDGYSYLGFRHEADDPTSLSHDWISATALDHSGRFWVATHGGGLNLMDRTNGRFEHFRHDPDDESSLSSDEIAFMTALSDGYLWIATSDGLNRFDPESKTNTRYLPDPGVAESLVGRAVRTVFEDGAGRVWVGTGNPFVPGGAGALNLFDPETGTFDSFQIRPDDPESLDNYVQSITYAPGGGMLVAPWSGGLYIFDPERREFAPFANPLRLDGNAPDPKVVNLMISTDGSVLWLSTYGAGLQRLDLKTMAWAKYVYEAENPFTIPDNRVWGSWLDDTGRLWIGTHGGLALTSVSGRLPRTPVPTMGSDEWVTDVLEGSNGSLWIGTSDNAVLAWNPATGQSSRYRVPSSNCRNWRFPGVGITSAKAGHLWVAGPCGLFAFYPERGLFDRVDMGRLGSDVASDQPIRLVEASDGALWIPAHPAAIRVDPSTGQYTLYGHDPNDPHTLSSPDLECVLQDRFGRLWIGTALGLNRFDNGTGGWIRFKTGDRETSSAVTSMHDAGDGGLWITTDQDGFEYFRPDSGRRKVYGIRQGLHNNTLMLSVLDDEGFMWALSPSGLSVVDLNTSAVRRFNTLDGLVDVRFGRHDMVVLSDGRIVIGGKRGVNLFDPRTYHPASNAPTIVIDDVLARGRRVTPNREDIGEPSRGTIHLPHDENDLVISYVGLRVPNPNQIRYTYQLEGVDLDWIEVGDERSARYSGLPSGDYFFKVRGATGAGPWSEAATLAISVRPPWWKTRWAYLLYFALFAGALILTVRLQARRLVKAEQQRARQRELEQARDLKRAYDELERTHAELKETQARLDEMKSRFFANISHEFRTPLTLIIGQTEALLAKADESDRRKLEVLGRNGRHLLRLINQLLDLSAMEANALELRPLRLDLIPFFRNLVGSFESLAHQKGIDLTFDCALETLPGRFERDKLEKIFLNLISNAIKFTESGEVIVALRNTRSETDDSIVVTVSDTGIGISPDRLPFIFDRFYQVGSKARRPYEGTGIGLALVKELVVLHMGTIEVESEEGKGTRFTVTLPLSRGSDADDIEDLEAAHQEPSAQVDSRSSKSADTEAAVEIVRSEAPDQELVLVIEDNPDVRDYVVENLVSDFAVSQAPDGEAGLAKAVESTPDLIVTDVMMPGMDGFELVRKLRSDQRTSHIPVIMLTARAGEDDRIEGLETGIDDYLVKPFSPRELLARVRNLIDQRKRLRARFAEATIITPNDVSAVGMDQAFLQHVLQAIEDHLGDDQYSVEALAGAIGMSVSQLNRKLGALIDQSAGKLIRSMRLQRAADLLLQQAGTVAEIAYRVGFGSHASFSTAFKKQFGVSPSEYGGHR